MKRRELFQRSLGLPVALSGLGASAAAGRVVVLAANAVSADLSISDAGDGQCFTCTLYRQPWPRVGERVRFDYKSTHLEGTVTSAEAKSVHGSDRWTYQIWGTVQVFTASAAKDAK